MVWPWLHYVAMSLAVVMSLLLLSLPCLRQLARLVAVSWRLPWLLKLGGAIYCGSLTLQFTGCTKPVLLILVARTGYKWSYLAMQPACCSLILMILCERAGWRDTSRAVKRKRRKSSRESGCKRFPMFSSSERSVIVDPSKWIRGCRRWPAQPAWEWRICDDHGQTFSCGESGGGCSKRFKSRHSMVQVTLSDIIKWWQHDITDWV